jgi:hypothetical protein
MANLSNINNKLIVTDGGNLLVNATANLATYGGITIDNFSDPSIAMKTTSTSGWLWTQYITSTGTNNFSMGVNQTIPYWCVKAGAGMDSPNLVVNSSGNVGIGTADPGAKLDIKGDTTTWDGMAKIYFTDVSSNSASRNWSVGNGGTDFGALSFIVSNAKNGVPADSTGTAVMSMDGVNKRVGIGTTSPDEKLDVAGNVQVTGTSLTVLNASDPSVAVSSTDTNYKGIMTWRNSGSENVLEFVTRHAGTYYTNNLVLDRGKVGIGIDSPEEKLHVEGRGVFDGGTSSDILQIRNDNGGGVFGMTSNLFALDLASTSAFRIRQGSSVPFYLKSDGNVGIGTTSPSTKFQLNSPNAGAVVGGTIGATIYGYSNNEMLVISSRYDQNLGGIRFKRGQAGSEVDSGSITFTASGTSFNTSSDYRLKEDLQDFAGLDMVSKIPVYDFKWKTDKSRSYGVMAHELQEILPLAVTGEKDAEKMQGVDYSKIIPLLVKSIQELKAEIELLKSK